MSTRVAYSTSTPTTLTTSGASHPLSASSVMRNIAAASAAATRRAEGLRRHDRAYGTWICTCPCSRCRPTKSDCGGCATGCEREFVSHRRAADFYASYGLGYDRAHGWALWD